MKVKVLIPFRDKHTGKTYKRGDVIEITPERYGEIIVKGKYVEPIAKQSESVKV